MAVDTFLKLARRCGSILTEEEVEDDVVHPPYIQTYLESIDDVLDVLSKPFVYVLYEALGIVVGQAAPEVQEHGLIKLLFRTIDEKWAFSVRFLNENPKLMHDQEFLQDVIFTLKCMTHAGRGIGSGFVQYLRGQLNSILAMYSSVNELLHDEISVSSQGTILNQHRIKLFRLVKKEILKALGEAFSGTNDPESISRHILPYVFKTILPDYAQSGESFRDAQFLVLLTLIVEKLRSNVKDSVQDICVFAVCPTLEMISRNMQDFPDLRTHIFKLLRALTRNCFGPFLQCAESSPMIVEGILWAIKHAASEISSSGVEILFDFLRQIMHSDIAENFYVAYFCTILTEIFAALTDTLHTTDFVGHVRILLLLLQIAGTAKRIAPDQPVDVKSIDYVRNYLQKILGNAYPNMNVDQIAEFLRATCSLGVGLNEMLVLMRDFIIESKEWGAKEMKTFQKAEETPLWKEFSRTEECAARSERNIRPDRLNNLPGFMLDKHQTSYSEALNEF